MEPQGGEEQGGQKEPGKDDVELFNKVALQETRLGLLKMISGNTSRFSLRKIIIRYIFYFLILTHFILTAKQFFPEFKIFFLYFSIFKTINPVFFLAEHRPYWTHIFVTY